MTVALVDTRMNSECKRALLKRGFRVIDMPPSEMLSSPVASHPDMLIAKLGNNIITTADYCERYSYIFSDIRELSPDTNIHITDEACEPEYPKDAILNALDFGDTVFIKTDTASEYLIDFAKKLGKKIIHTTQGYPACSAIAFGGKYAVTADIGLKKALEAEGIEVLLIENGDIILPPYEYGFIGGCSGVFGKDIYFTGDLLSHRSGKKIKDFIEKRGFYAVSLGAGALTDLGRIIFI